MESWTLESNVNNLHLTNPPNQSNRRKVKGPFYNSTSLMRCSSPMESRTIGSHVSIIHSANRPNRSNRRKVMGPSTKAIFSQVSLMKCSTPMESWTIGSNVGFLHLTNRPNRSNRRKVVEPFYNGDIFLANEMQHSNGTLDFSNRIYNFTIWQIERKDPMFMTHFPMESIWQYWTTLITCFGNYKICLLHGPLKSFRSLCFLLVCVLSPNLLFL